LIRNTFETTIIVEHLVLRDIPQLNYICTFISDKGVKKPNAYLKCGNGLGDFWRSTQKFWVL